MLSVCIRVHPWPRTNLRNVTERQIKQAIWPRMDTDTHGCGVPASSRSTGRRLEQNCMVMFWRNAILVEPPPVPCATMVDANFARSAYGFVYTRAVLNLN